MSAMTTRGEWLLQRGVRTVCGVWSIIYLSLPKEDIVYKYRPVELRVGATKGYPQSPHCSLASLLDWPPSCSAMVSVCVIWGARADVVHDFFFGFKNDDFIDDHHLLMMTSLRATLLWGMIGLIRWMLSNDSLLQSCHSYQLFCQTLNVSLRTDYIECVWNLKQTAVILNWKCDVRFAKLTHFCRF